jgi:hypothetical protein
MLFNGGTIPWYMCMKNYGMMDNIQVHIPSQLFHIPHRKKTSSRCPFDAWHQTTPPAVIP